MTGTINVALIGSKFMGRAHSNAWLNVPQFFDVDPRPVMHTVVGRNADELDAFAARWGWQVAQHRLADRDHRRPRSAWSTSPRRTTSTPSRRSRRSRPASTSPARSRWRARSPTPRRWRPPPEGPPARPSSGTTTAACPPSHSPTGSPGRVRSDASTTSARATSRAGADPSTPLVWRFQGEIAGSGAHGDLNAHIIDMVRFVTGEEIVSVEGAIEHTFIKERELPDGAGGEIAGSGAGGDRPGRHQHRRRRGDVPRPPERRWAGVVRGDPPRDRLPQRQPVRDPRRPGRAALRLRTDERARLLRRDRRRRDRGLDDDRRDARRRRASLRRRLVARQPRARLRARLRQPGRRHPHA